MSRKFDRPILEESKNGVESKSEDQEAKNNEAKDFLNISAGTDDTLSRGNLISEFLRHQKINMKDISQEEFLLRYEAFVKESEAKKSESKDSYDQYQSPGNAKSPADKIKKPLAPPEANFKSIVLKFTTLSDGCTEAPSFTVDRKGAKIGKDQGNDISVPSDIRLAPEGHATIEFHRGSFYITDGGHLFAASVRIGVGSNHKKWYLEKTARFSAGNSIFESKGINEEGNIELISIEGPLKGENLVVNKKGATFGRSSENTICVPDRELSRKHSKVEYDEKQDRYFLYDLGSTNGTYIQLVGPYGGRFKLSLNDHILVGRTGFSINRFDYGLSEEMGYRQSMEDACTIVQHLNIAPLCVPDFSPQSFFGVFDGHGGTDASHYLAQNLHVNVAHSLLEASNELFRVIDEIAPNSIYDAPKSLDLVDDIIVKSLKSSFIKTDNDFLNNSANPQHGSTATTALILGKRLYCANLGDSRTMICRNFAPMLLSQDHKPNREDEAKRIREAGGFVINNRVMGELAVSRAFGDVDFKKGIQSIIEQEGGSLAHEVENGVDISKWDQPLISSEPDVQHVTISEQDQFILLACDGLFDVFTPEEVVIFVRESMEKHGDTQRCCQHLTHDAIRKRNSRDNVSVILIILNKWY